MSTPEAQALVELAAKVEAAKGPDRELDLLIAQRFDPDWQGIYPGNFAGYVKHGQHPAYTASIDAAMTLAGNNTAMETACAPGNVLCHAAIWSGEKWIMGAAKTMPLTITAAALRALASLDKLGGVQGEGVGG